MRPHVQGSTLLLLAVVAITAVTARAAEEPAAAAAASPRLVRQNPMMTEIRTVLDAERETLARLHQRFRAAEDASTAQALQREIARVKLDSEVAVLRVQAKHARLAGRTAVAASLEAAIQQLLAPPVPPPAAPRPAPTPSLDPASANAQR